MKLNSNTVSLLSIATIIVSITSIIFYSFPKSAPAPAPAPAPDPVIAPSSISTPPPAAAGVDLADSSDDDFVESSRKPSNAHAESVIPFGDDDDSEGVKTIDGW